MRLNLTEEEPVTLVDFRDLVASKQDDAGHHMLWVSKKGDVWLDVVPDSLAPNQYVEMRDGEMKFRFETFVAGNGYVGKQAAESSTLINLYEAVMRHWKRGSAGYIEAW
jgi:hypothetical protein